MRIAVFEIEKQEQEFFGRQLPGHELLFFDAPLTAKNMTEAADADAVTVFIHSKVDEAALADLPKVRLIATRSMGFDHIDLAACRKRGITVSRVPAYGDRTVAEYAFALILALSRKICQAAEGTKRGLSDYRGLQGFDLSDKTLGLVGGGKIGAHVARIAKGFGMNVVVSDPYQKAELAREIGFAYVPLETLLAQSDVISLHAPSLPETRHLLNEKTMRLIKRGAILVNTARGALVEAEALLSALETGILSGAGLDVLEEERVLLDARTAGDPAVLAANRALIARSDVIVTPHIAFNSREAVARILETTAGNIQAFAAGTPINVVE